MPEACPSPKSWKSHVRVWYEPMLHGPCPKSCPCPSSPGHLNLRLSTSVHSVFFRVLFWIETLKFWTIKQILGKLYDLWECFRIISINLIFKVIWPITLLNYQESSVQYWRRTVLFTEDSHFLLNSPLYSLYHIGFLLLSSITARIPTVKLKSPPQS